MRESPDGSAGGELAEGTIPAPAGSLRDLIALGWAMGTIPAHAGEPALERRVVHGQGTIPAHAGEPRTSC